MTNLLGTRYIAIHGCADDAESDHPSFAGSENCVESDAYWEVFGDVVFVQVMSASEMPLPVGTYVRRNEYSDYFNVVVVVPESTITQAVFERQLAGILEEGKIGMELIRRSDVGAVLVAVDQVARS